MHNSEQTGTGVRRARELQAWVSWENEKHLVDAVGDTANSSSARTSSQRAKDGGRHSSSESACAGPCQLACTADKSSLNRNGEGSTLYMLVCGVCV